jgi:hypothetical protein
MRHLSSTDPKLTTRAYPFITTYQPNVEVCLVSRLNLSFSLKEIVYSPPLTLRYSLIHE